MKAIVVKQYGGPEVLQVENIEKPAPKTNEVLIKIKATSITAASTMMREGKPYFGRLFTGIVRPKVKTPGTDLAGIVEEIGPDVSRFKKGDYVMAETGLNCGAYANYIVLSEDDLIVHQPANISAEEATGIIDGASTALAFLTDFVQIKEGDKVLINGASGSIGTAAIQLSKYFGAEVTAVCSTKNKSMVKDLGADMVLDYTKNEVEKCREQYNVIFDTVGKLSFRKSKRLLTSQGMFMSPVLTFSALVTLLFISPFSQKKFKFAATGMRNYALRLRDLIKTQELLETGELTTVIDRVYQLNDIQEAHAYVDGGHKRGNVILSL